MIALAVPFVTAQILSLPCLLFSNLGNSLRPGLRLVLSVYSFSENKGLHARLL